MLSDASAESDASSSTGKMRGCNFYREVRKVGEVDFLCTRTFFAWKDRYVETEVQIEFPMSLSGSCGLAASEIHLPLSILVKYSKVPKKKF